MQGRFGTSQNEKGLGECRKTCRANDRNARFSGNVDGLVNEKLLNSDNNFSRPVVRGRDDSLKGINGLIHAFFNM